MIHSVNQAWRTPETGAGCSASYAQWGKGAQGGDLHMAVYLEQVQGRVFHFNH